MIDADTVPPMGGAPGVDQDEPSMNGSGPTGSADGRDRRTDDDEPTTWEPVDLGPYLRGEIVQPQPSMGITRSDGVRLIYPGREHAFVGETECGKTWAALACVAAELIAEHHVVYIHYEEADPGSTIERLLLLGVTPEQITAGLQFIGPCRPARTEWVAALLDPPPTLVVHDGVNEAMSLMSADIKAAEGASAFRRRFVVPFLRAGAASIACDHVPKDPDSRGRDAYGTVHKGNTLDGARIALENVEPFGRNMRGVSYVFVTKDRPGQLRTHGRSTKLPGKTFIGTLIADDAQAYQPFSLMFYAPKDDDDEQPAGLTVTSAELAEMMYEVIAAQPEHTVWSLRKLYARMRAAGQKFRESAYKSTVDDLIVAGRVVEVAGRRGATGFRAVVTAAQEGSE